MSLRRPRPSRSVVVALLAVLTAAAPLATGVTPAQGAGWTGPVIDVKSTRVWLSPNQDRTQDRARLSFDLDKRARVTVKVRRGNKARTLVYKEELGKLPAKVRHEWTWNGKNAKGKVVRDGDYVATFLADQVGEDGKRRRRSATMWVDTTFDRVKPLALSLDTVYPRTTQIHDALGVTLTGRGRLATVSRAELRVRDAHGRVVRRIDGGTTWRRSFTVAFDGRDDAGVPLPGGEYTIRARLRDRAGNVGRSGRVRVTVADRPLVERTQTVVMPPTATWRASEALAGSAPAPVFGAASGSASAPHPCGTVVPSEVYPDAGAASFRSDDTCSDSFAAKAAYAGGSLTLDHLTPEVAPRGGLLSAQVSMRGRPTTAGETDTALLTWGGVTFGFHGVVENGSGVESPATTQETVTATQVLTTPPPVQSYYSPPTSSDAKTLRWSIATRGVDSYDVADVTVTYSYLAPQQ